MPNLDRDYRLINAALATGDIGKPAFETSTYFAKIGLKPQTVRTFVHGTHQINAGFLGERREGGYILAFRGTLSGPNENADAVCADWTQDRDYGGFVPGVIANQLAGHVARGFWTALDDLWANAGLKEAVEELYRQNPQVSLWITGHSKGGAMAILLTALLSNTYKPPHYAFPEIVTFGAPRVGTVTFVTVYGVSGLEARTTRYQTEHDIVAKVPEVFLLGDPAAQDTCPGLAAPFLPVPGYLTSVGALTYIARAANAQNYTMETGSGAEDHYKASIDALAHMKPEDAKALIGIAHDPKNGYLLAFGHDPIPPAASLPKSPTSWSGAKVAKSDAPVPPDA